MNSQPTVVKNEETGEVINQNPNKPDYGSVRVDQIITQFNNGYLNKSKRVAFIGGRMEDLKEMGFKEGQKLNGKIVVHEQLEPFWEGQDPKINPETEEVITHEGHPVYRSSFYTDNADEGDQLLSSDPADANIQPQENDQINEELLMEG